MCFALFCCCIYTNAAVDDNDMIVGTNDDNDNNSGAPDVNAPFVDDATVVCVIFLIASGCI